MSFNPVHRTFLIALLSLAGTAAAQAQSVVEYGALTAKTGAATAAIKPPIPKLTLPTSAPGAPASGSGGGGQSSRLSTPGSAAAANRLALERRAGPDAAHIALRSVPDHAFVWIDIALVGVAPLDLKLAPGRHRVRMSAPNMEPVDQYVELAAKQTRQLSVSLKPRTPAKVESH
jgi:hypothetical protein